MFITSLSLSRNNIEFKYLATLLFIGSIVLYCMFINCNSKFTKSYMRQIFSKKQLRQENNRTHKNIRLTKIIDNF